jgi:hypothetical protein
MRCSGPVRGAATVAGLGVESRRPSLPSKCGNPLVGQRLRRFPLVLGLGTGHHVAEPTPFPSGTARPIATWASLARK